MQIIPYNSEAIQPAQITLVQAAYNGNDAGGPAAAGLPADTWTVLGQPMVLATTFTSRAGFRFLHEVFTFWPLRRYNGLTEQERT